MGDPNMDGTEGIDPRVKKISNAMEDMASQMFPRREHHKNRKTDRDSLYGRLDGTTPD